jgi:hypothetical protein
VAPGPGPAHQRKIRRAACSNAQTFRGAIAVRPAHRPAPPPGRRRPYADPLQRPGRSQAPPLHVQGPLAVAAWSLSSAWPAGSSSAHSPPSKSSPGRSRPAGHPSADAPPAPAPRPARHRPPATALTITHVRRTGLASVDNIVAVEAGSSGGLYWLSLLFKAVGSLGDLRLSLAGLRGLPPQLTGSVVAASGVGARPMPVASLTGLDGWRSGRRYERADADSARARDWTARHLMPAHINKSERAGALPHACRVLRT